MHKHRQGLSRRHRRLLIALFLSQSVLGQQVVGAQVTDVPGDEVGTRFARTAAYLQGADPQPAELTQMRADFAATALGNLASAYALEAERARQESPEQEGSAALLAWSRAVERYAAGLQLLLEDIELGFPVDLVQDEKGPLGVRVADRTVILSHPRLDQQDLYEQQVLADFCSRQRCAQFTVPQTEVESIPLSAGRVRPAWAFTGDGALCSYRGVHVRFGLRADLASARSTCEQFMVELMTLTHELAWQRRHGVHPDWGELTIAAVPHRPMHQVRLNDRGDVLLVTLPIMASSPGLLSAVRPWLEVRLGGGEPAPLELSAMDYGWE